MSVAKISRILILITSKCYNYHLTKKQKQTWPDWLPAQRERDNANDERTIERIRYYFLHVYD